MDQSLVSDPTRQEDAKLASAIDECILEIDHILKRMKRTRQNIEKLKKETRAMLATIELS